MIIKFNSKELKEVRKELIKDISLQEIRNEINKQIKSDIQQKVFEKIKEMSHNHLTEMIKQSLRNHVKDEVGKQIKNLNIKIIPITKEEVLKKININKIQSDIKHEIKKEIYTKLGK